MGNLVDLFAGSCSVANVARERGWTTFTSDIEPYEGIDYVTDILKFDVSKIHFIPDVVWASPPCEHFSVGSIGKHWTKDHKAKTMQAIDGVMWVMAAKAIINHLEKINPALIWFIENPRGKLRKLNILNNAYLNTVCYCKYGDFRMKPTDIWTNCGWWEPREMCYNGNTNCHHAPAPRGSKTGTQGMKNAFEKSKIPAELVNEILESCEMYVNINND
jgi:hypothetical protein